MLVAGGFLVAFLWAVRSGQFDDRESPSVRMLLDERSPERNAPGPSNGPDTAARGARKNTITQR